MYIQRTYSANILIYEDYVPYIQGDSNLPASRFSVPRTVSVATSRPSTNQFRIPAPWRDGFHPIRISDPDPARVEAGPPESRSASLPCGGTGSTPSAFPIPIRPAWKRTLQNPFLIPAFWRDGFHPVLLPSPWRDGLRAVRFSIPARTEIIFHHAMNDSSVLQSGGRRRMLAPCQFPETPIPNCNWPSTSCNIPVATSSSPAKRARAKPPSCAP